MKRGLVFSFIVSRDIADRIERVILINDGRIVSKQQKGGDIIFTVERT